MQQHPEPQKQKFVIHVNGRLVEFDVERPTAREILDKAGLKGTFSLAATEGEGGKVTHKFADDDHVDLKEYKHFRATFCGPEVVS